MRSSHLAGIHRSPHSLGHSAIFQRRWKEGDSVSGGECHYYYCLACLVVRGLQYVTAQEEADDRKWTSHEPIGRYAIANAKSASGGDRERRDEIRRPFVALETLMHVQKQMHSVVVLCCRWANEETADQPSISMAAIGRAVVVGNKLAKIILDRLMAPIVWGESPCTLWLDATITIVWRQILCFCWCTVGGQMHMVSVMNRSRESPSTTIEHTTWQL